MLAFSLILKHHFFCLFLLTAAFMFKSYNVSLRLLKKRLSAVDALRQYTKNFLIHMVLLILVFQEVCLEALAHDLPLLGLRDLRDRSKSL